MKTSTCKSALLFGIVFLLFFLNQITIAQVPAVSGIQCAKCLQMNGKHTANCPYNNGGSINKPTGSSKTEMESYIMGALIQSLFSSPQKNKPTAAEVERQKQIDQQREQALAMRMALLKRYNDSVAQARHDKMMKEYKTLEGGGELKYKGLDEKKWQPHKFNCTITSVKGSVLIGKADGSKIRLDNSVDAVLSPGDWIIVGEKSKIKLHYDFKNGGKDISIGERSVANIITDEKGDHLINMQMGKYYETGNSIGKTGDVFDDFSNATNSTVKMLQNEYGYKYHVRTPTAICGIRGTTYEVVYDSISGTHVNVFEGRVALINPVTEKFILLKAGQRGAINKSGELNGPFSISDKGELKWWED